MPTTFLVIYVIGVDFVTMEYRLPWNKLLKIKSMSEVIMCRMKVTWWDLQSLIRLLRFACSVVVPGRAFLRRVPGLICCVKNPHHNIGLTCEAGADLHTWHSFNQHYNGKFILLSSRWLPVSSDDYLTLFIDASRPVSRFCGCFRWKLVCTYIW